MYCFIVNPHSCSGKGYQIWLRVKAELDRLNIEYQSWLTDHRGHARELSAMLTASSHPGNEDNIIIAVGGDGTLNEIVDGMDVSSHITLGYIPTGSGNDFARSMKIPKNPVKALNRVLHPRYYQFLDYGVVSCDNSEVSHRRFVVSSGIGYDADVCYRINTSHLKTLMCHIHLTKLSYVVMGIQALCHMKPCSGWLCLDETKKIPLKDVAFVSSHIHKFEGGGFRFAPKADPCDGCFDVCSISHASRTNVIPTLLMALPGRHTRCRTVRIYRCRELSIHLDSPRTVHADGEILGQHNDVSLTCHAKQLRFIV